MEKRNKTIKNNEKKWESDLEGISMRKGTDAYKKRVRLKLRKRERQRERHCWSVTRNIYWIRGEKRWTVQTERGRNGDGERRIKLNATVGQVVLFVGGWDQQARAVYSIRDFFGDLFNRGKLISHMCWTITSYSYRLYYCYSVERNFKVTRVWRTAR